MKKHFTIAVLLALAFAAQAQIADFPYNQGFESGLDGWTTIDADDDGDNWFVANDGEGGPGNHGNWYLSHSGQKVAISRGYAYGGNAYDPDNYLVSPEIEGAISAKSDAPKLSTRQIEILRLAAKSVWNL